MRHDLDIVKEQPPGVFGAIMWCPTSRLLAELLDPDMAYVMVSDHYAGRGRWEAFSLPIVTPTDQEPVIARMARFDFLMLTERFVQLLPSLRAGIRAVQLRHVPPAYFDLQRIQGPERFRLLNECGWHVLLDTPAIDFGHVFSPNREVVAKAVWLHQAAQAAAG